MPNGQIRFPCDRLASKRPRTPPTQGRVGMKRFVTYKTTALALTLALACQASAQSRSQRTLADRLGSLRDGWSFSSDDKQEPAATTKPLTTPQRVAQRTAASQPKAAPSERRVAVASDTSRPFPRVNPRDLMPRSWFGVGVKERPAPRATATVDDGGRVSDGTVGSARARMLRDLRRGQAAGNVASVEVDEPTAKPRAGSALSPNAPNVGGREASQAAVEARLARSIAAEVAGAMAEEAPAVAAATAVDESVAVQEDPPAVQQEVLEPVFVATRPGMSLLPFGPIEGTTPTDTVEEVALVDEPAEEPIVAVVEPAPAEPSPEPTIAETDSGRISVAAQSNETTKLPLLIGSRYSRDRNETTVSPAESTPESPQSAGAFAGRTTSGAIKPSAAVAPEDEDLLFTQSMPVLVSKVSGPRTITVGREATYRVLLANRGDVGANRVVTTITVPEWAEVVSADAALGEIERDESMADGGVLTWQAGRLDAGEMVKLDLRLIARSGQPIELGVTHKHQPLDGSTLVEVQEPKLSLAMVGPEEVLFGKPQVFRLTIANPGTGAAENVVLHLTPPGGDLEKRTSHDFGLIGAGDERTVEIELTAREAGQLAVNAAAEADGDVSAETIKEVFCRKPELVVDWRGPADRFAGAPAVYYLRVRNPGTATAPDVVLTAELPAGFEVLPTAGTPEPQNGKLVFRAGDLRAGDDKFFELRGILRQAGANEIALRAVDSGETISERVNTLTEVVALADLKLDVLDPRGPVATGQEIAYKITVTNRGSNDARDVRVIGLFSDGIEPHHVDGGANDIRDGRVAFEKIDRMEAGEVRTFTIHARAYEEGTHLFRAEVLCRDLEIKLAAEETTRFFRDTPIDIAGEGYPSDGYPR